MTEQGEYPKKVADAFRKTLDRHGYSFQYRVLREVYDVNRTRRAPWNISAAEFPVEGRTSPTHIDFILENSRRPLYLVAECKRAHPALKNWCFASVPSELVERDAFFVEAIHRPGKNNLWVETTHISHMERVYHISMETKIGKETDSGGSGRSAIKDAANQVCRGLNGLIDFFNQHRELLPNHGESASHTGIVPVIITTASLWVSDVDLGSADLQDGTLDPTKLAVEKKPWVCYHYHQSPDLKHRVPSRESVESLKDSLYTEYVRPILIVNANAIADFLCWNMWQM